ncbi:bile salt-activated lipase [Patella vulgata]|uniref:bile salt-activated lipase n=1 Tax=Patella vulgata TaxID=6465 RepID=UPI00217FFE9B|nr:bile salt-activated lipase [Patella vulgata]
MAICSCKNVLYMWTILFVLLPNVKLQQNLALKNFLTILANTKSPTSNAVSPNAASQIAPVYKTDPMSFTVQDNGIPTKQVGSFIIASPNTGGSSPDNQVGGFVPPGNTGIINKPIDGSESKYPPSGGSGTTYPNNGGSGTGTPYPNTGGSGTGITYPNTGGGPTYPPGSGTTYPDNRGGSTYPPGGGHTHTEGGSPYRPYPNTGYPSHHHGGMFSGHLYHGPSSWMHNPFMAFVDGMARIHALRRLGCRTISDMYQLGLPPLASISCTHMCPPSHRCVHASQSYHHTIGFCCPFFVDEYVIQFQTMMGRYSVMNEHFF